jgi:capsular polysaccharide transport system permease protein
MLEYFAVGACFIFLGVSVGLLSATLIYFVPRFSIVVSLMSMPLYMLSGVMISVQHFGPVLLPYLMWNPLLHLAELARFAFLPGYPLMVGINFAYPLKWVVALSFLSLVFYWPNRQKIVGRD